MKEQILLGSYTKKASQGIYQLQLDTAQKTLSPVELLLPEDNPTYLCQSASGTIYSVTKVDGNGGIAAYKKQADGTFKLINTVTNEGAPPCYVAVDEKRQLVYGANYHKGEVTVYRINTDDGIELVERISHVGSGPDENQKSAHAHYADLTPDDRLVVCDLGTDEVYTYDVTESGKLRKAARYCAVPGTGPRHLVFHPTGQLAYLFGELASTLTVLDYDQTTGSFTTVQTISTIPPEHQTHNGGAALRISADGKFIYASNRGHNSIVVFAVSADGRHVETEQYISTEGDFPRDFSLDPSEQFVLAANQNTDNLTLYERDKKSGRLTLLQKDIYAPECVCIYFTNQ